MRTVLVIIALIVPVIALALPDDATLSRLLVGTWHGHRHDTQYRADGTWIMDPPDEGDNSRGKWRIEHGAKDIDKTVSYYAADAIVMPPNASSATTKEAIRSAWKEMLASPGAAISWKTTKVEVAKTGDLAYVSGTYQETITDASGKPVKDRGKYVEIFNKQADGTWKVVVDIWNSDLPAPAPSEKK
jgi:ketosteroid isomerase-like protein